MAKLALILLLLTLLAPAWNVQARRLSSRFQRRHLQTDDDASLNSFKFDQSSESQARDSSSPDTGSLKNLMDVAQSAIAQSSGKAPSTGRATKSLREKRNKLNKSFGKLKKGHSGSRLQKLKDKKKAKKQHSKIGKIKKAVSLGQQIIPPLMSMMGFSAPTAGSSAPVMGMLQAMAPLMTGLFSGVKQTGPSAQSAGASNGPDLMSMISMAQKFAGPFMSGIASGQAHGGQKARAAGGQKAGAAGPQSPDLMSVLGPLMDQFGASQEPSGVVQSQFTFDDKRDTEASFQSHAPLKPFDL